MIFSFKVLYPYFPYRSFPFQLNWILSDRIELNFLICFVNAMLCTTAAVRYCIRVASQISQGSAHYVKHGSIPVLQFYYRTNEEPYSESAWLQYCALLYEL